MANRSRVDSVLNEWTLFKNSWTRIIRKTINKQLDEFDKFVIEEKWNEADIDKVIIKQDAGTPQFYQKNNQHILLIHKCPFYIKIQELEISTSLLISPIIDLIVKLIFKRLTNVKIIYHKKYEEEEDDDE